MTRTISPVLYEKYKDRILRMSNSFQRFEPGEKQRGMSDQQIARKLGLTEEEVAEIRCIAELDTPPLENWKEAITHKRTEALKFINRRQRAK